MFQKYIQIMFLGLISLFFSMCSKDEGKKGKGSGKKKAQISGARGSGSGSGSTAGGGN